MDNRSDAEVTTEIRFPEHDPDVGWQDPHAVVSAQRFDRDRELPPPGLSVISRELWLSIVGAVVIPFFLVLLVAVHPWTFGAGGSNSAGPEPAGVGQLGVLPAPLDTVGGDDGSDTDADTAGEDVTTDDGTASAAASDPATEAAALTSILQQAHTVRQSVVTAVRDASACGDLATDQQALADAESARDSLAQTAADTPVDALPDAAEVPAELNMALVDSAAADQEFVAWVGDLESSCDQGTVTDDSHYQQAEAESKQASADKQTVLATWNTVASEYGQPTFSEGDI